MTCRTPWQGSDRHHLQDIAVSDGELTIVLSRTWAAKRLCDPGRPGNRWQHGPPPPALSVSIVADSIGEDGTTTATVSREGTVGDLVVTLSSDKLDEATVPAEVTIADGQTTSAAFTITAVGWRVRPGRNGDDHGVGRGITLRAVTRWWSRTSIRLRTFWPTMTLARRVPRWRTGLHW